MNTSPLYERSLIHRIGKRNGDDFPYKFWRFDAIKEQVIDKVREFNESDDWEMELRLRDVLKENASGTEHEEIIRINKDTVLVLGCDVLRHLEGFDLCVRLDTGYKECIRRKIIRTKEKGIDRSDEMTIRQMKFQISAMERYDKEIREPDVVIRSIKY